MTTSHWLTLEENRSPRRERLVERVVRWLLLAVLVVIVLAVVAGLFS